jgi:hypothetical protein
MKNFNFIIILGSFQKNTFEIIRSICDFLELASEIYIPQSGNQLPQFANFTKNSTIKFFDWNDFAEVFKNEFDSKSKEMVIALSPQFNLAEQFQKLFTLRKHFQLNIQKIIAITDHCYFDGRHENLLDAMAHFSDILLINNDPEIDCRRLKKFLEHCKQKECYPLPIRILSEYSVKNIPELLDDRPRRMTLIFDDLDDLDYIDESMVNSIPFIVPTLAQQDKYLKKNDRGYYHLPIESL